jgi:hypothetical protein
MTTKTEILTIIRHHCLTFCGGSWVDVKYCKGGPPKIEDFEGSISSEISSDAPPHSQCILWPYRRGRDPNPSPVRVAKCRAKIASQEGNRFLD